MASTWQLKSRINSSMKNVACSMDKSRRAFSCPPCYLPPTTYYTGVSHGLN